ncbi:sulfotransferase domain-containing protein [Patescibacteria group bacterium]
MSVEMNPKGFKVDFTGVGFPKCGTTWISKCLREHPDIDFSKTKETDCFVTDELKIYITRGSRISTMKEYIKEFKNDGRIKGEFSVRYIFDKKALKKIRTTFPDIKILICIRDPVQYLYSSYWFLRYSHLSHEIPATFEGIFNYKNGRHMCNIMYGKFSDFVAEVYKLFPKEKIHVIVHDDIKNDSKKVTKELYEFLGVDPSFIPSTVNRKVNWTRSPKSPIISKSVFALVKTLEYIGLGKLTYGLFRRDNPLKLFYRKHLLVDRKYPAINKQTEKKLRKLLLKDIGKLEKLVGRDLSTWKNKN